MMLMSTTDRPSECTASTTSLLNSVLSTRGTSQTAVVLTAVVAGIPVPYANDTVYSSTEYERAPIDSILMLMVRCAVKRIQHTSRVLYNQQRDTTPVTSHNSVRSHAKKHRRVLSEKPFTTNCCTYSHVWYVLSPTPSGSCRRFQSKIFMVTPEVCDGALTPASCCPVKAVGAKNASVRQHHNTTT